MVCATLQLILLRKNRYQSFRTFLRVTSLVVYQRIFVRCLFLIRLSTECTSCTMSIQGRNFGSKSGGDGDVRGRRPRTEARSAEGGGVWGGACHLSVLDMATVFSLVM